MHRHTRRDWNHLLTLRWDTASGEHQITGTSRDIHEVAPRINRLGNLGEAWNIAVLDKHSTDLTGRFFDHLDRNA